ncbi:Trk potassium uptake system protein TrkH [Candidatus Syntrophocurvum alkaliphilum]|uniref:Trk potassium uptake system protein TrkH n=1 Tax=Candidatus Syntrophocurvum alkaliphilum TaxID=2293317 RepID=A0A6I6DDP7_9FIRM|nr:TrkH family potassium uptake protein [Candidatus Syntrophocurvum alkaliphilum]QGT99327.1 Trk potassium uptake system protein TrkH [Candidatus Syntrophocurvum alkaliphilum]
MIRSTILINYVGKIVLIVGLAMLSSVIVSLIYKEDDALNLFIASVITIGVGLATSLLVKANSNITYREGFAIVAFGWIAASLFGTLPFVLTGYMPTYADALFETVSGFTTTGASVLSDIEALPYGLLFWRSLTQWLGGMGIMILFIAIITGLGVRAKQIYNAEIPGGTMADTISPRIRETAKILWKTYMVLSVILCVLLYSFGMNLFDALAHTFTTMPTGGFSTKNESIAAFSPAIQWIIIIFMFIGGVNFALHYFAFTSKSIQAYIMNAEFRLFCYIIIISGVLVVTSISSLGGDLEETIRNTLFQVISIGTTTGFATADYDIWPPLAKTVLLMLMFIGASSGSTTCNIKVGRYLILFKQVLVELKQMVHPKAIISLKMGQKTINQGLVRNVLVYFFMHMVFVISGAILLSILQINMSDSISAAISCMGNIGPGFGAVGPTENYSFIPDLGKYYLSFLMILGRLEIFPVLVLLLPHYWRE